MHTTYLFHAVRTLTLAGLVLLMLAQCTPVGNAPEAAPTTAPATPTVVAASPPTATPALPTPTATPEPLPSIEASPDLGYMPILMYHYVREIDEDTDPMGFRLSVTPERFDEQMAWLRDNDYTTLGMTEMAECLREVAQCPENPVALTFDDGYEDSASAALPVLERYGFTATFFIAVNLIGQPGYMTWEQVELLHDSGMEIGSHTMNHADLTGLNTEEAYAEIVDSQAYLERRLDISVQSFSYPAGSHTLPLMSLVRAAGYTNAVIAAPRNSIDTLYDIPRRRVLGGETIAGFPWYFVPFES